MSDGSPSGPIADGSKGSKEEGEREILVKLGQSDNNDDYADKQVTQLRMAHNLKGDVCKFAVLEHIDTGDPRTTDLDLVVMEEEEEENMEKKRVIVEEHRESSELVERVSKKEKVWMCDSDKDDLITVKYLPLPKSSMSQAESGQRVGEKPTKEHLKERDNKEISVSNSTRIYIFKLYSERVHLLIFPELGNVF